MTHFVAHERQVLINHLTAKSADRTLVPIRLFFVIFVFSVVDDLFRPLNAGGDAAARHPYPVAGPAIGLTWAGGCPNLARISA
jgi:hypothetical protein